MEATVHIEDLKRIEALAMRGPWFTDTRCPLEVLTSATPQRTYPWELVARVGRPAHFPPQYRDPHIEATLQLITLLRNLAPDLLELWKAARLLAANGSPEYIAALAEYTRRLDELLATESQRL